MTVEQDIEAIRGGIKAGRYPNEASVSQGIVLRLLSSLGWECFDPESVSPEYSLGGRRVDYALCSPPGKPIAFIEVKQIGQSDGAERQLFEYAFHAGVPMAILTDGREWNFFLPGEQGDYGERRVYKLDLVDREIGECVERLERYLNKSAVASGEAMQAARDDYRNASRVRQMQVALPKAWADLIADEDDLLLEIVADRVESLCGFKPDPDMVATFLKRGVAHYKSILPQARSAAAAPRAAVGTQASTQTAPAHTVAQPINRSAATASASIVPSGGRGFAFQGEFYPTRNAMDTLQHVFEFLMKRDPTFADRFAGLQKHGRSRRYLSQNREALYPGREDLVREHSVELPGGWWASTNHSRATIARIIEMACEVAGVRYGSDLVAKLD